MKKFCTKCGKPFEAVGREVICPACKAAAAEEVKRAAVLRAKRASWTGESVPVRISGRASTVIRYYGTAHNLPFAAALDELLKASEFFKGTGKAWDEVEPYKSHRRDRNMTQDVPQDVPQDVTSKPQEEVKQTAQEVKQEAPQASKQAAKTTSKTSTAKKAASKASKK